jgi:PKD repeat protein
LVWILQRAAKTVVFDSLDTWFVGRYDALADFSAPAPTEGYFGPTNLSMNTDSWLWDMGDGTQYTDFEPTHFYTTDGAYTVQLIASQAGCLESDTAEMEVVVELETGINQSIPAATSLLSYQQDWALLTVLANDPDMMLQVVDLQGRLCLSQNLSVTGSNSLSLAHLATGTYVVRIFRSDKELESQMLRVIH